MQAGRRTGASAATDLRRALRLGVFSGTVGAVALDVYRLGVAYAAWGTLPEDHYRQLAAGLIGPGGYALPGAAYAGVLIQLVYGATVGVGFAWLALRVRSLASHPLVAGTALGFAAYALERIVATASGLARTSNPRIAFFECVAHTLFFGIPIALIASAKLRNA